MISGAHVPNAKPLVAAIMLTAGRPEMAQRAIRCFLRQTYKNKRLMILDSTPQEDKTPYYFVNAPETEVSAAEISINQTNPAESERGNIGRLRNYANTLALQDFDPDILIHWDDDDVSGPERIEQQVAYLQATGKELVGYRSMYFLDQRSRAVYRYQNPGSGYCLGTSLCYTRKAFEICQFVEQGPRSKNGSDTGFMRRLEGRNLVAACDGTNEKLSTRDSFRINPPMFATLHAQTTNSFNQLAKSLSRTQSEFTIADEESAELVVKMFEGA